MSPMLEPFNQHLEGIFGCMPITLGGETSIKWQQLFSLYQVNQISYPDMTAEFEPFYLEHGVREWEEMNRNRRRGMARDEQLLAGVLAAAEFAGPLESASRWIKYRQMMAVRLLTRDLNAALLQQQLDAGVATNSIGPYEFSPEVIAKVRARVKPHAGGGP